MVEDKTVESPTMLTSEVPPSSASATYTPAQSDDTENGRPDLKSKLQALYDKRVTATCVPTIEDDLQWAKQFEISRKRVRELRSNNSEAKLHRKGPRRRPKTR
jgi:hypothetical protein